MDFFSSTQLKIVANEELGTVAPTNQHCNAIIFLQLHGLLFTWHLQLRFLAQNLKTVYTSGPFSVRDFNAQDQPQPCTFRVPCETVFMLKWYCRSVTLLY